MSFKVGQCLLTVYAGKSKQRWRWRRKQWRWWRRGQGRQTSATDLENRNNWVSSKTLSTIITVVVQCDYCCWQLTVFLMIRPNCHSPNVALTTLPHTFFSRFLHDFIFQKHFHSCFSYQVIKWVGLKILQFVQKYVLSSRKAFPLKRTWVENTFGSIQFNKKLLLNFVRWKQYIFSFYIYSFIFSCFIFPRFMLSSKNIPPT